MKKLLPALLLLICICITGCAPVPTVTADGTAWSDGWVTVGGIIGVDTPDGIDLRENNDTLSMKGMYYATWSIGESEPYTNEDGEEAQLYDAQIYLLLAGYSTAEKAEESAAEWQSLANDRYTVSQTLSETCSSQSFTILTYTYNSDTNPFSAGASAFGVYRNYALSIEVSCRETFTGDPQEILTGFLDHIHYSA